MSLTRSESWSRRALLSAAGVAGSAGLLPAAPPKPVSKIVAEEFWAEKKTAGGTVKLNLYRKRAAKTAAKQPVLFLVHGSSISARPSFDLATPGLGEYSVMNVFAQWGYDVWTMDHENYGRSSQTSSNSDIASGADDLQAAMDVIVKQTGQSKAHFCGESSGAIRAAVYAMRQPSRLDRLVVAAFTYTGKGSSTLAERGKRLDEYRASNRRLRDRDMIRSIATRDKPGTTDPRISEFLADEELKFGDKVPTGTYLDMTANLPLADPLKIPQAVLLLRGEYDGIATMEDLQDFFVKLPSGDKQFVVLPGMAHSVVQGKTRQTFWHATRAFLELPNAIAS